VSWVLTTLLLSTFYAFRKTRKKPFPLYFTGCIFLVTTGLCFTVGMWVYARMCVWMCVCVCVLCPCSPVLYACSVRLMVPSSINLISSAAS